MFTTFLSVTYALFLCQDERTWPPLEDKTAEYAAIFDENIKAHGTDFEAGIAMEEWAELIQAISKVRRYGFVGKYRDNLLEEIADVDIVLTELTMMFDIVPDEFFSIRDRKVQRIKERLEENKDKRL